MKLNSVPAAQGRSIKLLFTLLLSSLPQLHCMYLEQSNLWILVILMTRGKKTTQNSVIEMEYFELQNYELIPTHLDIVFHQHHMRIDEQQRH